MSSNYTTVHVAWVINVSSIPLHFQDAQGALCRGGMAGLRDANTGACLLQFPRAFWDFLCFLAGKTGRRVLFV